MATLAASARTSSADDQETDQPQRRGRRRGTGDDSHGEPPFEACPGPPLPCLPRPLQHLAEVCAERAAYGSSSHASSMAVEVVLAVFMRRRPPRLGAASCIGVERRAQRLGGPMEPRLRGPQRDAHGRRGVGQRQSQVVVKDDDRAVLGIEAADAALDLISVGGRRLGVSHRWGVDLGDLDLDAPALGRPELRVAGVQEDPVESRRRSGRGHAGWAGPASIGRASPGRRPAHGRDPARMRRAARSSRPIVAPASTAKAS